MPNTYSIDRTPTIGTDGQKDTTTASSADTGAIPELPLPFFIDRTPAVCTDQDHSKSLENENSLPVATKVSIPVDKFSGNKALFVCSEKQTPNAIEDKLDNMNEVDFELISVKPAPMTTSNEVIVTGNCNDVEIIGKCKAPPTSSSQSGIPPAAK